MLAPLGKVNLVAGQNNSGKSNVLRVVHQMEDLTRKRLEGLDIPVTRSPPRFELIIRVGDFAAVLAKFCEAQRIASNTGLVEIVRRLLADPGLDIYQDESVWLKYSQSGNAGVARLTHHEQAAEVNGSQASQYAQQRGNWSSEDRENANTFLSHLAGVVTFPKVQMVHAFRRIQDTLDGTPLIERLASLQSPDYQHYQDSRARFEAINRFIQTVMGDSTASLVVPDSKKELLIGRGDDFILPLDSLGSGISQVILLAAHATVETNIVLCMEEPEVNLHPLLQRKLIRYLNEETQNQYVIATHSAHVLDSAIASIFHTTLMDDGTHLTFAGTPAELSKIGYDLGYRPSDLLQTNFAIWVEGPSDRLYISYWLWLMNEELREGIHYSIMFYGGRLLSHLSTEDPLDLDVVEDFISLRRLNRHLAVVIDSDKASSDEPINRTKERIETEVTTGNESGCVWITEGRYVESYIPPEALTELLRGMYPLKVFTENTDSYSDALRPEDKAATWRPDKVKLAKKVCKRWKSGLDYLDLYDRIRELTELIEKANDLQSPERRPAKVAPVFEDEDA